MESRESWAFKSEKLHFILKCLTITALLFVLTHCGHKRSKDVGTGVLPEKPIVITADAKDVFGTTIPAPWFSFRPVISNGADSPVTVISLKLSITGMDAASNITTVTHEYVPSGWAWSRTTVVGTTAVVYACQFAHFGVFLSGEADQQLYLGGDSSCPPCDPGGNAPGSGFCVPRPIFYFGGGPGGPNNSFTTWTVQMTPTGWFGVYDNPEDRFTGMSTFRTQ